MSLATLLERTRIDGSVPPRTDHLPAPDPRLLQGIQAPALRALRRVWDIRVHGAVNVPRRGPVIIAANHTGTLDGPLVVFSTGRPTYALAKEELFSGPVGRAMHLGGQIPLGREYADFPALRRSVHLLRHGQALAIFPEGMRDTGTFEAMKPGVAYLAMVTGAPVVPCALFGTRLRGAGRKANPPRGARIDVVYGSPISIPAVPWPRRRADVAETAALLQQRLAAHVRSNERWTGMELPGPVDA